ncbi:hypothetical protein B7463_g11601, partial [Scytalidium lignicola]
MSTDADALQFQSLFDVVLSKGDGEKLLEQFNPGCSSTRNLFDVCSHPGCVVTVTPSKRLYLRVQNKAAEHGPSLFVYIFSMSCFDWEIEEMLKASGEVIPPKGSRHGHEVEATGNFKMKFKFQLDEGQKLCEDIVKVFITARPASFMTLARLKLGSHCSYANPVLRTKRGGRESEDWVAITFRVRVVADLLKQ